MLFACMAGAARTEQDDANEKKITIGRVPPAARAAILKAVGKGRIVDIGEITAAGKVVRYEIECMQGAREIDIVVAPDGKLLDKHVESGDDDKDEPAGVEVVKGKLSPAAAAAVRKGWPKAAVREIEVERAGGVKLHKVVLSQGGKDIEVEISPRGAIVSTQEDVGVRDLPADLRKAVRKALGGGKLGKIEKEVVMAVVDGGKVLPLAKPQVIYEVKFSKDGSRHEIKLSGGGGPARKPGSWRTEFGVDRKNLVTVGKNPYFPLVPGHRVHLQGDGEKVVITVLDKTKVVDGVRTRIVEEREFKNGRLVEVSRNYFAIDKTTNDIYYFGEDVDDYDRSGKVVGHGGAWLSGVKGAKFGLGMPGKPVVGDRYYQEIAPNVAMDRAEIVQLNARLKTPMKTFARCLYVRESSDLERGYSPKWYAAGVGMIGDDDLRIIKVEYPPAGSDAN